MAVKRFSYSIPIFLPILLLLVACGGGGGGSSTPAPAPAPDNSTPSANINAPNTGQVLLGPIVGANVFVYPLEGVIQAAPICSVTTTGVDNELGPGVADLSACSLEPTENYLLVVRDGEDIDADDDGVLDETPTPKVAAIRSVMTGEQIASGNWRINLTTEIGMLGITSSLLQGEISTVLLNYLDNIAQQLFVTDIDGDDVINRFDLAAFVPADHITALRNQDPAYLANVLRLIFAGDLEGLARFGAGLLQRNLGRIDLNAVSENFRPGRNLIDQELLYSFGETGNTDNPDFTLQIFDVSNPYLPTLVGELDIGVPRVVNSLTKSGDNIFVAAGSGELIILDVADPAQPVSLSVTDFGSAIDALLLDGDTAFISSRADSQIRAIDVSDLSAPTPTGTLTLGSDSNQNGLGLIGVSGEILYIFHNRGLTTANIRDLNNIEILDEYPSMVQNTSDGFVPSGVYDQGFVYLAAAGSDRTLGIIDVSDPNNIPSPTIFTISAGTALDPVTDMAFTDGYLYVRGQRRLFSVRINSPGSLRIDGFEPLSEEVFSHPTLLDADRLYVDGSSSLIVYDQFALRGQRGQINSLNIAGAIEDIGLSGDEVFIGNGNNLTSISIADVERTALSELDSIGTGDTVRGIFIQGDYAYIANNTNGLTIVDISDPSGLNIVGNNDELNDTNDESRQIAAGGNHVYMSVAPANENDGPDTVGIFNVSDPTNPVLAGVINGLYVSSMEWHNDFLYLGLRDRRPRQPLTLEVYDVSDPANPTSVDRISDFGDSDPTLLNELRDLHVEEGYLYAARSATGGLHIFDVSSPGNLVQTGFDPGFGFRNNGDDLAIVGDVAYVANSGGWVDAYNIRDKTAPAFFDQIDVFGIVKGVVANERHVFITNDSGLVVNHVFPADTSNLF